MLCVSVITPCSLSNSAWRKRFRGRIGRQRKSLWYLIRHLPSFWSAKNQFEPDKNKKAETIN